MLHHLPIHSDHAFWRDGLQPQCPHLLVNQVGASARQVGTLLHGEEKAQEGGTGDSCCHIEQMNHTVVCHCTRGCPQVLSQVGLVNSQHQDKVFLLDHCPALWDWLVQTRKQRVHQCSCFGSTLGLRSLGGDSVVGGVGDGVVVGICADVIVARVLVWRGVGDESTGQGGAQ